MKKNSIKALKDTSGKIAYVDTAEIFDTFRKIHTDDAYGEGKPEKNHPWHSALQPTDHAEITKMLANSYPEIFENLVGNLRQMSVRPDLDELTAREEKDERCAPTCRRGRE